ncbi:PREDICTED: protein DEPP [Chinchilla lanigera]|uniref:DEPP autophagy regulator 1 n=1 Tax=Chinchilla lanigera TaxID=34839 RepID=A0A8C2YJ17_CHILA|nr:PREDICTED: protein DEPP [Chinchilla lanigera]
MRSRLLLSVAPLPTIRETSEEMLPADPGPEPPASPSLEDYVKSICQLAQPTTVLDKATTQGRASRPHWAARDRGRSPASFPQEISPFFSGPRPTLPSAGAADPLDWLFGESQKKQSLPDLPRAAVPSARPWGTHRQADRSKARTPERSLVTPSQHGHQSASLRSRTFSASRCSPRPSSILRSVYSQLPVIHEL